MPRVAQKVRHFLRLFPIKFYAIDDIRLDANLQKEFEANFGYSLVGKAVLWIARNLEEAPYEKSKKRRY